jgi:hypothetical protein
VQFLVHRRAPVGDAGCHQHRARGRFTGAPGGREQAGSLVPLELGDELGLDLRAIFAGLVAHALKQLLAVDAVGKTGVVASAGDPRGAALAAVDDEDVHVESCEVDRGGQASRAAADDQAVENRFVHPLPNGLPLARFPTSPHR